MMNTERMINEEEILIPAGMCENEVIEMVTGDVSLVGDIVDYVERQGIINEILENEIEEEIEMVENKSIEELIMDAYETGDEFQIMVNEGIAEKFIEKYQIFEGEKIGVDTNTYAEEDYKKFTMFLNKHKIDLNKLPKDTKLAAAAYKVLSYDIFPEDVLKVLNIKVKENIAVVEMKYWDSIETDILIFEEEIGTVTVIKSSSKIKDITKDTLQDSIIRRATYPANADETLVYASKNMTDEDKTMVINELNTLFNGKKSDKKNDDIKKKETVEEAKEVVEEAKVEETNKDCDDVNEGKLKESKTRLEQFKSKLLKRREELQKNSEIILSKGIGEFGKILTEKEEVDNMTVEEFLQTENKFVLRYLDKATVRDVIVMDDVNNRPSYEFIKVKNKLNTEKMKDDMNKVGEDKYIEFMANELYGHVREGLREMSASVFAKTNLK